MTNKNLLLDSQIYVKEAKPLLEENSIEEPPREYKHSSWYFTKEGEIYALTTESGTLITIDEDHSLFGDLEELASRSI